jgi:hypothetical protein
MTLVVKSFLPACLIRAFAVFHCACQLIKLCSYSYLKRPTGDGTVLRDADESLPDSKLSILSTHDCSEFGLPVSYSIS